MSNQKVFIVFQPIESFYTLEEALKYLEEHKDINLSLREFEITGTDTLFEEGKVKLEKVNLKNVEF